MPSVEFAPAELVKFDLLAEGIHLTPEALEHIRERNPAEALTPADYASTSGVILVLDGDVWVNAPFADFNANFVVEPPYRLEVQDGALAVTGKGRVVAAEFWTPPAFHNARNADGEHFTDYGFAHTDRVRVSPIEGCSMACQFCNLPYEFKYRNKSVAGLVETVRVALADPVQPASHVLISGGTPRPSDYGYLNEAYDALLAEFSDTGVDIMMVPIPELIELDRLARGGVDSLSMNIEIYNRDLARRIIRRKYDGGLEMYLDFLAEAAGVLGPGRCRSMLMVGLEPLEDTLAGVAAIAERGCVPVLSPFRPDPATPLRHRPAPSSALLQEAYLRAREITEQHGVRLGPRCIPCSHNTLTLATSGAGDADHYYGHPHLI